MVRSSHCRKTLLSASAALLLSSFGAARAQEFVIYPAKGQSQEQMEKDKFECYTWAKGQSGFDPMAPPTATTAPPAKEEPKGGVLKGAVVGALAGAAVGSFSGNAGTGAAIGAAGGGVVGGMRRKSQTTKEEKAQQDWEQQQVAGYSEKRTGYNRNFAACMEGRGYTVK